MPYRDSQDLRRQRPRIGPNDVRTALATHGACTWAQLVGHLDPPSGGHTRALRGVLEGLVASGEVSRSARGGYRLDNAERIAGTVVAGVAGKSGQRLRLDDGRSFDIAPGQRARPGDQATALAINGLARAVRIVKPAETPVVGVLSGTPRQRYVEVLSPALKGRLDLTTPTTARPGAVVKARLVAQPDGRVAGRVIGVVEGANDAALAAEALLSAHDVPREWSSDPGELARLAPPDADEALAAGRVDLRPVPLVTIDGADAKDFDDAVFAEPLRGGGWRLLVAIADVAHYVRPGTAVDRDAATRGNSLYLPDRVVPMLPEALSNDLCSLRPRRDRLVIACELRVSAGGSVSGHAFNEALMRSRARLTYDEVDAFLSGRHPGQDSFDNDVGASLKALSAATDAFREAREQRGALDIESSQARVKLQDGRPIAVEAEARNAAHLLIEEAMIAANVAAAEFLEARGAQGGTATPLVYRVHEPPTADKLEALASALRLVGERLPSAPLTPEGLAGVHRRAIAKSSWPRWIWDVLLLRSLTLARYETRRLGHFGLALPAYAHFTSPIRRYADLLVHRMIKGVPLAVDDLNAAATHISMTERRAEEVERGVDSWLKCVLAEARIGQAFAGTVAAVMPFGLFVELHGLGVQGLLHVSGLGRDYFEHAPEAMCLVAERSGARFTLGDRVDVVIQDVSPPTGRIDLALANAPADGGRRRGRRRRGRR